MDKISNTTSHFPMKFTTSGKMFKVNLTEPFCSDMSAYMHLYISLIYGLDFNISLISPHEIRHRLCKRDTGKSEITTPQ